MKFLAAILFLSFGLLAQKVEMPVAKTQLEPEYPTELKYYLVDHPTVQLSIDEKGVPFALQSTMRIPSNVVSAIRQWRFQPAHTGNRPVAVAISMVMPVRRPLSEAMGLGRRWASTDEINAAYKTARDLDESGLAAIEQKIAQNPNDVLPRLIVIRYTALHDSAANAARRLRHVRWFAEISRGFELLAAPEATPRRAQAGTEDYEALRKLWRQKLEDSLADPAMLDNATNFLRISDPAAVEAALLKATKDTDHAVNLLGELYAFVTMGVTAVDPITGAPTERDEQIASSPVAGQAREKLLKAENMRLLFAGLNAVSGSGDAAFCAMLLERAKSFYSEAALNCEKAAPKSGGGAIRVGGNVQQANLLKQPRPAYPQEAKSRGITGTVKFEARIGRDGRIHDLQLLSGPFALYDSARGAVEKWEYRPTKLNGEPVEVVTTIDVNYTLSQ